MLAKMNVTGNSARTSETSIGGFNTKWADNLTNRALAAAAEQLVEYLEQQKAGA